MIAFLQVGDGIALVAVASLVMTALSLRASGGGNVRQQLKDCQQDNIRLLRRIGNLINGGERPPV